ncbi:hypothetical protein [Lewinella cohaerens]|uniref:hypothetical protein n=1 Tax=Lewinella cohaerens TaxID=70995 RepID=UPI000371DCFC|nr:hypothetical protein [Lewinella cohaerens]
MMRSLLTTACLLALPFLAAAQSGSLDKIFMLGTEEQRYEQLTSSYSQSLLEASAGDITKAFEGWLDMQQAIDSYANSQNFDLNGVRLWLHVFWAEDGQIDQMGFLLRPDSRLVDEGEIKVLLAGFVEQYRLPIQSGKKFNHYTGAAFPTLSQRRGN